MIIAVIHTTYTVVKLKHEKKFMQLINKLRVVSIIKNDLNLVLNAS